jgi:predicted nucleotidyltransferase
VPKHRRHDAAAELRRRQAEVSIATFLDTVRRWGAERSDLVGIALVGSHARGTSGPDSDIDLVILSECPEKLLDEDWPPRFGGVASSAIEEYGALTSRRIFYENGLEVEFGIAGPEWASIPLDAGTRTVLADGVKVLYDPQRLLRDANDAAAEAVPW